MIIGIHGKIGSGKDAVANIIKELQPDFEIKKFADKPKEMVADLLGCTRAQLENQEFKKLKLGLKWGGLTVRKFLQQYATGLRETVHEDIWVNVLAEEFENTYQKEVRNIALPEGDYLTQTPNGEWVKTNRAVSIYEAKTKWMVSDLRFINEAKFIKSHGGVLVRVVRDTGLKDSHRSENELNEYNGFHYQINNNRSLDELYENVVGFLEYLNRNYA